MLHITQVASIDMKVDEEKYVEDVSRMWEDFEEGSTDVEPKFKSGYGSLWEAVAKIGFEIACETNLDWESDSFCNEFKLYGGGATDYNNYHRQLAKRLAHLSRWVQL